PATQERGADRLPAVAVAAQAGGVRHVNAEHRTSNIQHRTGCRVMPRWELDVGCWMTFTDSTTASLLSPTLSSIRWKRGSFFCCGCARLNCQVCQIRQDFRSAEFIPLHGPRWAMRHCVRPDQTRLEVKR